MASWNDVHVNRCEEGFYDQRDEQNIVRPELTVPLGTRIVWVHSKTDGHLDRPEADAKSAALSHPEVYPDGGAYSAAIMWTYSDGKAALVSNKIYVTPGAPVRGDMKFMQVIKDTNAGARYGIVIGGANDPFESGKVQWNEGEAPFYEDASIVWGQWRSTYDAAPLQNRVWVTLATPEVQIPSTSTYVRFIWQFNNDLPHPASGHGDVYRVQQYTEVTNPPTPPPPPTGDDAQILIADAATLRAIAGRMDDIATRVGQVGSAESKTLVGAAMDTLAQAVAKW